MAFTDFKLSSQRIFAPGGSRGLRIHDLRHSFASGAVTAGQGLPMIGKLLGHSQVLTTARYAHLSADPVKAASERVSRNIAVLMGETPTEVIAIKRRSA